MHASGENSRAGALDASSLSYILGTMTKKLEQAVIVSVRHSLFHLVKDTTGLRPSQIASIFNVDKSTVTRALRKKAPTLADLKKFL